MCEESPIDVSYVTLTTLSRKSNDRSLAFQARRKIVPASHFAGLSTELSTTRISVPQSFRERYPLSASMTQEHTRL